MDKEEHISNSDNEDNKDNEDVEDNEDSEDNEDNEDAFKHNDDSDNDNVKLNVDDKNNKDIKIGMLSTEGVVEGSNEYNKLSHDFKNTLKRCSTCEKVFSSDMISNPNDDYEQLNCWHCFFWINYDSSLRSQCDGTYGLTIADYVVKCRDDHSYDKCTRKSDNGGCFLCEHKIGLDIPNIIGGEKINQCNEKSKKGNDSQDEKKIDVNFGELLGDDDDYDENNLSKVRIVI